MKTQETSISPDHAVRNRLAWDRVAPQWVESGRRAWSRKETVWGIWGIPEREVHLLPEQLTGLDVIELGCGTAYVSAWIARRAAHVTGVDNSIEKLKTARAFKKSTNSSSRSSTAAQKTCLFPTSPSTLG